jgi:phospho-N-acetylmuramoyl-pentapeptide-transferase
LSFAVTVLTGLALSIVINYLGLVLLRRFKYHQTIRLEGPQSHHLKSGTPTMGGLMIIFTLILLAIFFIRPLTNEVLLLLAMFAGTGVIGGIDDYLKIVRGKNNGLQGRQKIYGQFIIAALFCFYLMTNKFYLLVSPFLHLIAMNNPVLYVLLSAFIIIGTSNAVNLTDGLDGLAGGVSAIVFLGFAFIAHQFANPQLTQLAIFSAIACLGFLAFNCKPAKMFMGDVGSLALGTLVAGFALLLHAELYLLLIGIVFVIETLSVILQVGYFKLTKGKRIFKMSPLHHHYELCGYSEKFIVHSAWLVTALAVLLAIVLRVR